RDALPTVDFALAVLAHATGMGPGAAEVVFAVARTAGWVAHIVEEYAQPRHRFRWRSGYTGPPPRAGAAITARTIMGSDSEGQGSDERRRRPPRDVRGG